MFYVGSIVRVCFASYVLEGTLQILVSGLYWYFVCVACSTVRKTFEQATGLKMTLRSKDVTELKVYPSCVDGMLFLYCKSNTTG